MIRSPFLEKDANEIFKALKPADIIAFQVPKVSDHIVSLFQNYFDYSPEAKRCVHAALYLGHGKLCHSLPFTLSSQGVGSVRIEDAYQFFNGTRTVYILRNSKLSEGERKDVALFAATRAGYGYGWEQVAQGLTALLKDKATRNTIVAAVYNEMLSQFHFLAGRKMLQPENDHIEQTERETFSKEVSNFLCSDLVYKSYDAALQNRNPLAPLLFNPFPFCSPADLFSHPNLTSVSPFTL